MGNFYTDVIYKDSRFNSVKLVNDVALLEPKTRQIVQEIIAASAAAGLLVLFAVLGLAAIQPSEAAAAPVLCGGSCSMGCNIITNSCSTSVTWNCNSKCIGCTGTMTTIGGLCFSCSSTSCF